jgi:benzoyl-CoA reductase/2-hydroxyglutaryl-CoA dehydratase subunit BcrC/BadD/HgdB
MNKEQFDPRYGLAPHRAANPRLRKRSRFVAEQQLELQQSLSRRPANIEWFEQALDGVALRGRPDGVALVGCFCNMVPVEVIYALGARPVQLGCGNPVLVQSGEEALAGDICPLAKASFGDMMDGEGAAALCDAVVLPASCDAKRKLAEVVADHAPTFVLNLPTEQDAHRYGKMAAAEVRRLAEFLCGTLGRRLSRRRLRDAIEVGRRRTALVRALQSVRAAKPAAMSVCDLFLVVQASFAGTDLEEWLAQAGCVLDELRGFEPERRRLRPRLVLTGAPIIWPNFKPLNIIEQCGADVVADTLCTGAQSCYDPVVYDESGLGALMRALALRYVFGSVCPCFVSQGNRISRVLDLVEEFHADGVVNYGLRLCQLFDMESYRLARVMKEHGIPFANMRTDYSLEDTEQLRVRLEAFLETIGEEQ